jgi:hypothetical protein
MIWLPPRPLTSRDANCWRQYDCEREHQTDSAESRHTSLGWVFVGVPHEDLLRWKLAYESIADLSWRDEPTLIRGTEPMWEVLAR